VDPITIIGAALTLGIAAGLKSTAEQAIKDAYTSLKQLVERRYNISLSQLEKKPESPTQLEAVKEALVDAKANQDAELLDKANALIVLIKQQSPETAKTVGVDFDEVEAGYIKAKKIVLEGNVEAIKFHKVKTPGGIDIEDVNVKSDPNS
jgi:hypothetical protein